MYTRQQPFTQVPKRAKREILKYLSVYKYISIYLFIYLFFFRDYLKKDIVDLSFSDQRIKRSKRLLTLWINPNQRR